MRGVIPNGIFPFLVILPIALSATEYEGIEFPAGEISFADEVVAYAPDYGGGPVPSLPNQEPERALGIPRTPGGLIDVSLGNGGRLTLRFTDNSLTGSGDREADLWIFEVGSNYGVLDEAVWVEISKDGLTWFPVGIAPGSNAGIDIDAYGFGPDDRFSLVRLTDDGDSYHSGATGADIDAVGASSSGPPAPRDVNQYVLFEPVAGSASVSGMTSGCPADAVAVYSFDAMLSNQSGRLLSQVQIAVPVLSGGNSLRTSDGPVFQGGSFPLRASGDYGDGYLGPGQEVRVPFQVCLMSMAKFRFIVDVLAVAGEDTTGIEPYMMHFEIDGHLRRARVHPNEVEGPAPVLIFFHGAGGWIERSEYRREFHELWPEAIVVYAQGLNRDSRGIVRPPGTPSTSVRWALRFPYKAAFGQRDDVDYVQFILDHLRAAHEVDEDRLYAVGYSSGGFFTFSLMELMADQFDGFAVFGAYARYKVDMTTASLDNGSPPILPLIRGQDRARYPRPVLYMFGSWDTVFNRDSGSNGWPGWHATQQSLARTTIEQLIIRNDTRPADFDMNNWSRYWGGTSDLYPGNPDGRWFLPLNAAGAPVFFRPFEGSHYWPLTPHGPQNGWVIEFLKSL